MSLIHDDFLLSCDTARRLYHDHAAHQPIYDYHCHLPPADIAANRGFDTLYDVWLAGDHYKWRAMRAAGIDEAYITGSADPYDKFTAWAKTVPQTLRNPLYHWTHLELVRYFGIDTPLDEGSAREVWDEANRQLAQMRVGDIFERFRVALVCTTDDPADDLAHHAKLAADRPFDTVVYPAFRPDKACEVRDPAAFAGYVERLEAAAGRACGSFADYLDLLTERHRFFHDAGCRLSDHGLDYLPATSCTDAEAARIYETARAGQPVRPGDRDRFLIHLMLFFGRLDAKAGWTKQLHLGALRSTNTRRLRELGPDTGFDSIGDWNQTVGLARYLDAVEQASPTGLPRTILYNLDPSLNEHFAAMAGNFQDGRTPGKVQHGSGWWFLDQKDGITRQLDALSNIGLLSRFVGMLTDSRSFLSYPRHEYFRRVLCDLLGREAEAGELPRDMSLLGPMVEDICFHNARRYFGMPLGAKYAGAG